MVKMVTFDCPGKGVVKIMKGNIKNANFLFIQVMGFARFIEFGYTGHYNTIPRFDKQAVAMLRLS